MNTKQNGNVLKLDPFVVNKIWGGRRLAKLKKLTGVTQTQLIGETWEIAHHPMGMCKFAGKPIDHFIDENQLPYIIKFIDTLDNLSVQVHPDDNYAKVHEHSSGKTECWIILDADKNSGIFLGFNEGVTKKQFVEGLQNKQDMSKFLKFYPVKRGDFFFVPAGSVHAIGSGVFLAEVQQRSGITYRVWDWNRVDKDGNGRQLHIEKAMDVLQFGDDFNRPQTFNALTNLFDITNQSQLLVDHQEFQLEMNNLQEGDSIVYRVGKFQRLSSLVCFAGSLEVKVQGVEQSEFISAYESALFQVEPGAVTQISVYAKQESAFIFTM
ncbi:MAG: class I mannose-6-phosphate isomerase [Bacteriovoracaceae bacterium]|nr:class I mannose-6-phosphate isomerase [Bacteriovoracaceae bacterium]